MASYVPPKKNAAHRFYVSLVSQANIKIFQVNPTLAAGDAKVSIDGGAFANLATLPAVTPAGSKAVQVDLSAAEMNGDNIAVILSDAAGAEWCDLTYAIQTTARLVDDLAYPATSGRSLDVDASGRVLLQPTQTGVTIPTVTAVTKLLKYVQLLARKDAAIATDNAAELTEINANGGSGAGAYANTTDSQEAIRDFVTPGAPVDLTVEANDVVVN